jgi:hypothetical protein
MTFSLMHPGLVAEVFMCVFCFFFYTMYHGYLIFYFCIELCDVHQANFGAETGPKLCNMDAPFALSAVLSK